jgi:hypothetical protein
LSSNHILLDCARRTLIFQKPEAFGFSSANHVVASLKEEAQGHVLISSLEVAKEDALS